MPGNKSKERRCMASCIEWHLPVQGEADWLRLFLFKNEVENIKYHKVSNMNEFIKLSFLSHARSAHPQY